MNPKKLEALLSLIIPQVIGLIATYEAMSEIAASSVFYTSRVYALLEQEDTKMWQLSPMMLFQMYEEEKQTGHITFPEG